MDDTAKIQPALTAVEWAIAADYGERLREKRHVFFNFETGVGETVEDCIRRIALNNHALPDDDPRKITKADVELIRDAERAELYDETDYDADYYTGRPFFSDEQRTAFSALAAKLAALLPPEHQ